RPAAPVLRPCINTSAGGHASTRRAWYGYSSSDPNTMVLHEPSPRISRAPAAIRLASSNTKVPFSIVRAVMLARPHRQKYTPQEAYSAIGGRHVLASVRSGKVSTFP